MLVSLEPSSRHAECIQLIIQSAHYKVETELEQLSEVLVSLEGRSKHADHVKDVNQICSWILHSTITRRAAGPACLIILACRQCTTPKTQGCSAMHMAAKHTAERHVKG